MPIVLARCCRLWEMPAPYWAPWGKCGVCGERPEFESSVDPADWPDG